VVLLFALGALGQTREATPMSVCQLLAEPARYSGKQVTLKAEVIEPRRIQLVDSANPECGRIPWMYPTNPDVKPKAKFSLVQDEKFKELQDSIGLMLPPPPGSSRERSRIMAVLEGRFDSVYRLKDGKAVRFSQGIGYLGADEEVFVLRRVLRVEILPDVPPKDETRASWDDTGREPATTDRRLLREVLVRAAASPSSVKQRPPDLLTAAHSGRK
jgi:hypothetical protein